MQLDRRCLWPLSWTLGALAVAIGWLGPLPPACAGEDVLELREHLQWSFQHELISVPVEPDAAAKVVVRDEQGRVVPCQVDCPILDRAFELRPDWPVWLDQHGPDAAKNARPARVRFFADLPGEGKRRFTWCAEPMAPTAAAGMQLVRQQDDWTLDAGPVAIRVPAVRGPGVPGAPILAVRGGDGTWRGQGAMLPGLKIKSQQTLVLAAGPVFAVIACRYRLEDGGRYDVVLRALAGEPVVLVSEHLEGPQRAGWRLVLAGPDAPPDAVWAPHSWHSDRDPGTPQPGDDCRRYAVNYTKEIITPVDPYHPWEKDCTAWWAGVYGTGDALGMFALHPAKWRPNGRENFPRVKSTARRELVWDLSMVTGRREWGLVVTRPAESSAGRLAALLRAQQVKYAAFPLDVVKDWVLDWPEKAQHPRLLIRPEELPKVRARVGQWKKLSELFAAHRDELDDPEGAYLISGDESIARLAAARVVKRLDKEVRDQLRAGPTSSLNIPFVVGTRGVPLAMAADCVLASPSLSAAERKQIRASLAFLAYVCEGEDFWPAPGTGIDTGNGNFATFYHAAWCLYAAAVADHPRAPAWLSSVEEFFGRELRGSIYPGGAWVESPNYQLHPLYFFMCCAAALANSDRRNFLREPEFKSTMDFAMRIQTPYDPRVQRHLMPTVGDTALNYHSQRAAVTFAWAASLARDDPAFSHRMMFAWRRAGCPLFGQHLGWLTPACLIDPTIPAEAPSPPLASEGLPGYGALLRTQFNTDRETYFLFKCGAARGHFDPDEGSFHLYALGKPLALDYGSMYWPSITQPWFHNRLSFGRKCDTEPGTVLDFVSFAGIDYVRGEHSASASVPVPETPDDPAPPRYWEDRAGMPLSVNQRRVVMIKDRVNPYFVIADAPTSELPTEASYHVLAKSVERTPSSAHFVGQWGVDLDLFVTRPATPKLTQGEWGYRGFALPCGPAWSLPRAQDADTVPERQHFVRVAGEPNQEITVLLWPRPASAPRPHCDRLASGAGLHVVSGEQEDWVFCSARPVNWAEGNTARFVGQVGALRRHKDVLEEALIVGSRIGCSDLQILGSGPVAVRAEPGSLCGQADGAMRRVVVRSRQIDWRRAKLTVDGKPMDATVSDGGAVDIDLGSGPHSFAIASPSSGQ